MSKSTANTSLWVALHFPLLPLELRYDGDEASVLAEQSRVVLANQAAIGAGVESGMALATASSLCQPLRVYECPSESEVENKLHELALWSGQFSALISLHLPTSLVFEIASMQRYFGGVQALWQQLSQAIEALPVTVDKATGHTPLAALCLARAKRHTCALDAQGHMQILTSMPVSQIGLAAKQQKQLHGMGLFTLGHLEALEREGLSQRFGPSLLDYLDRLTGRRPDPQRAFEPPPEFAVERELYSETDNAAALLFPLKPMLQTLQGYLRLIDQKAHALALTLHHRDKTSESLTLTHAQGASEPNAWLELWRLKLGQYSLQAPVLVLTLTVVRFVEGQRIATDLFDDATHESSDALLNRIVSRLGEDAVMSFCNMSDPRPEVAGQLRSGSAKPSKARVNKAAEAGLLIPLRPLWLLAQPEPLERDYVEACIQLEAGPERVVSGWWQQPMRRDYYRGRWPQGALGWLFLDDQKQWYLHGWFG